MFKGPFSITGEDTSYTGWFVSTLLTSLLAYPVFFGASLLKLRREAPRTVRDLRHCLSVSAQGLLPFLFMLFAVGFFVVGIGTAAISWFLNLAGLPEEYFNLSTHPEIFYGSLFGLYALRWLFSVIVVVPRSRHERLINL